jgi:predicted nucleic acid-binding protein
MATTGDSASFGSLFVDTNVLVYANVIEAPEHAVALAAIKAARKAERKLWISRQVLREYLMTMTRPQAFVGLPREIVLDQVRRFTSQFEVANDTAMVSQTLVELMAERSIVGKQVHDANIVATMIAYDIPALLTRNTKDFARFKDKINVEALE